MKISLFLFFLLLIFVGCSNNIHNYINEKNDDGDKIILDEDNEETEADDEEIKQISNLKVEINEKNVLSCRLTFKTKDKIKTIVKYFSSNGKGFEIVEDIDSTEHYYFLWGMKAQRKYTIEIYSYNEPEKLLDKTQFLTGEIPDTVPVSILSVNEKDKIFDGFVLFTYSASLEEKVFPIAMMMDTDGEIVWYFEYYMAGFNIIGDLQYIENKSTILVGLVKGPNMTDIPAEEAIEIDLEGNVLWKSREFPNMYGDEYSWHHTYELLPDDSLVFLNRDVAGTLLADKIMNVDRDYNELWIWSYLDHFEPPDCDPSIWCDWTHSNTVTMFKDEGVVYLNSRNLSQYFKIDIYSGEIVWTFGQNGDFTIETDNPKPWFEFAHDPEILDFNGNKIIFYDNGSVERGFSRVIEYTLDFEKMNAVVSFVYDGSEQNKQWFTEYWGDADNLPNGNIFVTAGLFDFEQYSRLFEITREGELVWELIMDKQLEWMITLYNAQKFSPPIKRIENL